MVRAKFRVTKIAEWCYGGGKEITLAPQYDTSIPEDQRYAKATPSGEIYMQVDNPAALEVLSLGTYFYVDFTPIEAEKSKVAAA
jgi:hypothetical protein